MAGIPETEGSLTETIRGSISHYSDSLFELLSRKWILASLTVLPAIILFVFLNIVPIGWSVLAGFHEISAFSPVWEWVGLENYRNILAEEAFWNSVMRSLIFAGGSVAIQLTVGTAFAFLLNRSFKFNNIARAIGLLPYLIPTAILAFIAQWMLNSQFGIINQVLVDVGLINSNIPWLGSPDLAMPAVILINSWKLSIFVTIMVLARLQGIPNGFYEAAEMAGASRYQKFRDITLPNLKSVIFIVLLLRGVWMFNKFDIIYILTRGGPQDLTTTVPIYAFEVAFPQANLGEGSAISTLLFGMLVVAAMLYFHVLEPSQEVRVE